MKFPGRRSYHVVGAILVLLAAAGVRAEHAIETPGGVFQLKGVSDLSARELAESLAGCGILVTDVRFIGTSSSAGLFKATGTGVGVIGFAEGLILSSGAIWSLAGPNSSDGTSSANGLDGDSDLDALLVGRPTPGDKTFDATVLEFDFVPSGTTVTFDYVFSSEEYNEYVNSTFNDVFAFFLNGVNVALLPGTTTFVSIDNVSMGNPIDTHPMGASEYYINNARGSATLTGDPAAVIRFETLEMDGLTTMLSVSTQVIPGKINRIKFAVADTGDSVLDSNVFIRTGSFSAGGCGGAIAPPGGPPASAIAELHAFPNPFQPGSGGGYDAAGITLQSVPPGAEIRIYSLAGELVAKLEDTDGNGMEVWDGKNGNGDDVASGIYYIVAIVTPPGGPTERQRTKLVVVR